MITITITMMMMTDPPDTTTMIMSRISYPVPGVGLVVGRVVFVVSVVDVVVFY